MVILCSWWYERTMVECVHISINVHALKYDQSKKGLCLNHDSQLPHFPTDIGVTGVKLC